MIDKTDILIKNKLNSVESNPPAGLWDKLEPEVDNLNNQAFDEAVKDKLHDVAGNPSAGLYSSISKSLAKQKLLYRLKLFGAAASVVLIASLLLFNNEEEIGSFKFIPPEGNNISDAGFELEDDLIKESFDEKTVEYPVAKTQTRADAADENISNINENTVEEIKSEKISPEPKSLDRLSKSSLIADNNNESFKQNNITSFSLKKFNQKYGANIIILNGNLALNKLETNKLSPLEMDINYYGVNSDKDKSNSTIKRNPRYINKYSLGVNYSPTAMYLGDNIGFNHALGLDLKYQNMNLIIQSGIMFEYVKEEASYELDYNRYEFKKKQLMFDSLDFSTVDNMGRPTPVNPYYVDVYDSSNYVYNSVASDHYLVLKIPLMVGYQWNRRDFGVFVKAGVSYNINAYQRRTGVYKLDANSTQNSFYYPVKNLYESNFEYLFSSGFDYYIKGNISFTSEFIAKYYQKPIYRNVEFKNRLGLGLKLGILYEL